LAVPLSNESLLGAGIFNDSAVFRLEEALPTDVEAVGEIAHVHQTEIFEFFPDGGIQLLIDPAAIHDRRAPAFFRGNHAKEADARRPGVHVRTFVVVEDGFVCRIRRRGVDLAGDALTWKVAIFRVDLFVDGRSHALKILRRGESEAAEKNAAMLVQLGIHVIAIVARPLGKVYVICGWFHYERQGLVVAELALANRVEMRQINRFATYAAQRLLNGS